MIRSVLHYGFTVSDLEEAISFFRDLLGFELTVLRKDVTGYVEKVVGMPGTWMQIAEVTAPDGSIIELIEYTAPKGEKINSKTCNPGVGHIAFVVDNLQGMYQDLSAKGVQFVNPPIFIEYGPHKGMGVCYLKGPDGITLEFLEPAKAT